MMPPAAQSTFPEVGGHTALDLVDTVHWRLDPRRSIDTLSSFDAVVAWCEQMGVLPGNATETVRLAEAAPAVAAREHAAVLALREAVYEAVFKSSPHAAAHIASEYVAALERATIERGTDGASWSWRMRADLSGPRGAIALLAQELLTSDFSAARQCGDDACGWVYLDTSPRHNRVWCTAAGCGNRNRVARHQAKRRGATTPQGGRQD
ncbi:CGNR zinc finger domain-containing protein [Curtobacterium flaccumfaciens]|uniref:CGNR zinc finger domain-containing protein n=1 Tax=Curtobacterium flaccumfaciens TaxID=2035 RepID=UPI003994E6CE